MQIRNSITLIGNLGQDPETFKTETGTDGIRFSLATNEYWKDKEGNRQTRTEWHQVVAFGSRVPFLASTLQKGNKVAVAGNLRYNKWVDKHEQSRSTAQVHLSDFALLDPKTVKETAGAFAD